MEDDGKAVAATRPPLLLDGEDVIDWTKEEDYVKEEAGISALPTTSEAETADPPRPATSAAAHEGHEEIESLLQELQLDKKEKEEVAGHVETEDLDDREEDKKRHLNVVFIGHVDAGKSTTGGQILLLSGQVDDRTIQKYEKEAKDKHRESWYMAYIMDTNEEERIKDVLMRNESAGGGQGRLQLEPL